MRSWKQPTRIQTLIFEFETYDTYQWYLDLGPLSNINAKYLHGKNSLLELLDRSPDYDDFLEKRSLVRQLHASTVPNLNVADSGIKKIPGAVADFPQRRRARPEHTILLWQVMVSRLANAEGDSIGLIPFAGHETAREFRENMEHHFSVITCTAKGETKWQASTFSERLEQLACLWSFGPEEGNQPNLYLHADGTLSFTAPGPAECSERVRAYVFRPGKSGSVPAAANFANVSGRGLADVGGGRISALWMAGRRDDVVSAPLTMTSWLRAAGAALFASTSGTDGGFCGEAHRRLSRKCAEK